MSAIWSCRASLKVRSSRLQAVLIYLEVLMNLVSCVLLNATVQLQVRLVDLSFGSSCHTPWNLCEIFFAIFLPQVSDAVMVMHTIRWLIRCFSPAKRWFVLFTYECILQSHVMLRMNLRLPSMGSGFHPTGSLRISWKSFNERRVQSMSFVIVQNQGVQPCSTTVRGSPVCTPCLSRVAVR